MNNLSELKNLINNKNWQKFCTGEDWSDPAFKYVLSEIFHKNASYHRKQWEFVVIFLCLMDQGKLHGDSVGASFGAGKEPLIYDLLPYVKSFLATDLYSWNTGWDTAKMGKEDTPMDFLHRNAPLGLSLDNLQAEEVDMRKLEGIKDNSLDFCYSSCAIEHIGHREDFISHLNEVKRTLKQDGVYVVTTELLFNHDTVANKGNYKFDIEYLRELFIEAGLDSVAEFDGDCYTNKLNVPRPYVQPLVGSKNIEKILPVAAILDIEGVAYTSCCFILSPSKKATVQTFEVAKLDKSSAFVQKKVNTNMLNLYTNKRSLDPFYSLVKKNRLFLDDHMQFRVIDEQEKPLIELEQPNFCYTNFVWFNNNSVDFEIDCALNSYEDNIIWFLIEKEQMQTKNRKKIKKIKVKAITNNIVVNFKANPKKVYAIMGQVTSGILLKKKVKLSIERLHITAKVV